LCRSCGDKVGGAESGSSWPLLADRRKGAELANGCGAARAAAEPNANAASRSARRDTNLRIRPEGLRGTRETRDRSTARAPRDARTSKRFGEASETREYRKRNAQNRKGKSGHHRAPSALAPAAAARRKTRRLAPRPPSMLSPSDEPRSQRPACGCPANAQKRVGVCIRAVCRFRHILNMEQSVPAVKKTVQAQVCHFEQDLKGACARAAGQGGRRREKRRPARSPLAHVRRAQTLRARCRGAASCEARARAPRRRAGCRGCGAPPFYKARACVA
jgi:hypothetical protein